MFVNATDGPIFRFPKLLKKYALNRHQDIEIKIKTQFFPSFSLLSYVPPPLVSNFLLQSDCLRLDLTLLSMIIILDAQTLQKFQKHLGTDAAQLQRNSTF